jgi:hypothetical protein
MVVSVGGRGREGGVNRGRVVPPRAEQVPELGRGRWLHHQGAGGGKSLPTT